MAHVGTALILVAALINLLPVTGVISADRLKGLYGLTFADPNLIILMRHRAVLFGIVGVLLVAAALNPSLRPLGFAVGFVSMVSYLIIAFSVGDYNAELNRVVVVDVVGVVALCGAAVIHYRG